MVIREVLFKKSLHMEITGKLVPTVLAAKVPKRVLNKQARTYVCRLPTSVHMLSAAGDLGLSQLFCLPDLSLSQLRAQRKYELNIC